MALVSNIVIDLASQTGTLTVTKSAVSVETITYSSNQITYALRADIVISVAEFHDLIAQINIFETALLFNFNIQPALNGLISSINCTEAVDNVNNKCSLACIYGASPRVVNYSADLAAKTVDLQNRASDKSISLPEWNYLLLQLAHYNASLRLYLGS